MQRKQRRLWAVAAMIAVPAFGLAPVWPGAARAQSPSQTIPVNPSGQAAATTITATEGTVTVLRKGEKAPVTATRNMALKEGDIVRTGARSRATLRCADGSREGTILTLQQYTSVEIKKGGTTVIGGNVTFPRPRSSPRSRIFRDPKTSATRG